MLCSPYLWGEIFYISRFGKPRRPRTPTPTRTRTRSPNFSCSSSLRILVYGNVYRFAVYAYVSGPRRTVAENCSEIPAFPLPTHLCALCVLCGSPPHPAPQTFHDCPTWYSAGLKLPALTNPGFVAAVSGNANHPPCPAARLCDLLHNRNHAPAALHDRAWRLQQDRPCRVCEPSRPRGWVGAVRRGGLSWQLLRLQRRGCLGPVGLSPLSEPCCSQF